MFCPRLSRPEAPFFFFFFFFALYDVRIWAAQLVRNKVLREIAGGEELLITLLIIQYPVVFNHGRLLRLDSVGDGLVNGHGWWDFF